MVILSRKLKGSVLVLIVAFSAYLTIVQIVNTYPPSGILKSFSVKSLRGSASSTTYLMGDSLIVEAESDWASEYDLRVYANSSQVFESRLAGGAQLKTQVPLVPAAFAPGKPYTLSLDALVLNNPIIGASYTDSASYTFDIARTQTVLGLNSTYDTSINWLYSLANLTDADGYPVANETVSFYLQLKGSDPLTDGWIPLGSRLTDDDGTALMSLGFPLLSDMTVKACHGDDGDFGACETSVGVEVTSNCSIYPFLRQETYAGHDCSGEATLDAGTVNMSIDTLSPYALLPVYATSNYSSTSPLDLNPLDGYAMMYYLDNLWTWIGGEQGLKPLNNNSPYGYQSPPCPVVPTMTGAHELIGALIYWSDVNAAETNATGLVIASQNTMLNILPCPSNLVLNLPQAAYGTAMPITVGFVQPWPCASNNDGEFTASSLAPQIAYEGVNYAIDEPVNTSVPVSLYVNGTFNGTSWTDTNGIASFQLNSSAANSTLSINCTANASTLLLNSTSVVRNFTLTSVNVNDSTSNSSLLNLGCTVDGQGSALGVGNATVYVQDGNPVDLSVSLNGSAVSTANASILTGKPLARNSTDSSGWVSVPSSSSLLRVDRLCGISDAGPALCDVNHNGQVDSDDLSMIAWSYGSYPGAQHWNWRCDLRFTMKVDGTDEILAARNFGSGVNYANATDYSAVTANFLVGGALSPAMLDTSGCVAVPNGASGVNFTLGGSLVGAVVEFFNCSSHQASLTDNSGQCAASWVPPETGNCSLNSINSGIVSLEPYIVLAWLPSRF
jgi:hypothetical protein